MPRHEDLSLPPIGRGIIVAFIGSLLAACAGKSTRPETGACAACLEALVPAAGFSDLGVAGLTRQIQPEGPAQRTREQQFSMTVSQKLQDRISRRGDRQLNILVLSGGGAWGAYGAGVLQQWGNNMGHNPIDLANVDLVTGISTGALQSIFVAAALGSDGTNRKAALDDMVDAYDVEEADIFNRKRCLPIAALFSNSLHDAEPLFARVQGRLDLWKTAILQSEERGIVTLVGTVQLEDGGFYVGRLDQLLNVDCGSDAPCATTAVLASAAVPLPYPPRFIGGRTFVDGGVRQTSFMGTLARNVILDLEANGTIDGVNLLVLRNGTLSANRRSTCDRSPLPGEPDNPDRCLMPDGSPQVTNGLESILTRSIQDVMTNQIDRDSLYRMSADLELIRGRANAERDKRRGAGEGKPVPFQTSLWLSHIRNRDLEVIGAIRPPGVTFDRDFLRKIREHGNNRAAAGRYEDNNLIYRGAFLQVPDPWFTLDETQPTQNLPSSPPTDKPDWPLPTPAPKP
jgi:predicted acylesterase/phospholipase RssA